MSHKPRDLWSVVGGLRMFLPTTVFASCWCSLDAKQDKLPAFLGSALQARSCHRHSRNTSHFSVEQSSHNKMLPIRMCEKWYLFTIIISTGSDSNWFFSEKIDRAPRLMRGLWPDCAQIASLYCLNTSTRELRWTSWGKKATSIQ